MVKKEKCGFCCKKSIPGNLRKDLCKECFKKLEKGEIAAIDKLLRDFKRLKPKDALMLLKEDVIDMTVKMQQLKDYLVASRTIYDEDFKKFCLDREAYENEKQEAARQEVGLTKVYIVSLQKNKKLREYYKKHRIEGANFIEATKISDFKMISDGDMIYFLSSDDVSREIKDEISKAGSHWNIKIAVSQKKFRRLNDACLTYVKACKDYKETHKFLKALIECITTPSLVGLDYADIRQLFMMSSRVDLRKYKANLSEKDEIVKEIKKEFKKIDGCFVVVSGGTDFRLDDISGIAEQIGKIAKFLVHGARIEEELRGKIEVSLFAGWRK